MFVFSKRGRRFDHTSNEFRSSFVDIISTVSYLVCGDEEIRREHFRRIFNSRNVPRKLFQLADTDGSGDLSVNELMEFLVILSAPM